MQRLSAIAAIVVGTFFFLIGIIFLLGILIGRVDTFSVLFGVIATIGGGVGIYGALKQFKRLNRDYNWYKAQHPACVQRSRTTCHKCGGSRIGVRNLMGGTYMRAHICNDCGTTLYYSKET